MLHFLAKNKLLNSTEAFFSHLEAVDKKLSFIFLPKVLQSWIIGTVWHLKKNKITPKTEQKPCSHSMLESSACTQKCSVVSRPLFLEYSCWLWTMIGWCCSKRKLVNQRRNHFNMYYSTYLTLIHVFTASINLIWLIETFCLGFFPASFLAFSKVQGRVGIMKNKVSIKLNFVRCSQ